MSASEEQREPTCPYCDRPTTYRGEGGFGGEEWFCESCGSNQLVVYQPEDRTTFVFCAPPHR
jgi:hypothetical protein